MAQYNKLFYTNAAELAAAPPYIGRIFVDVPNLSLYVSFGTSSPSDWKLINVSTSITILANLFHSATEKTAIADADEFAITDSEDTFSLKKITWDNLKVALSAIYATIAMTFKASTEQIADATLGTGTHTFDFANGNVQKLTATGNITISFANVPAGKYSTFVIYAVNWGAHTITLPSHKKAGGVALSFTAAGEDRIIAEFDSSGALSLIMSAADNKL